MPTGFMPHFIALLLLILPCVAGAQGNIALIGTIGDKAAVLALDGGDPKTVKVGQKWNGILVVAVERERATIELDGKRRILQIGQHYRATAPTATREKVTLMADGRGMFIAEGSVNGLPVRFLVDTGATYVSMSARDAMRLGVDYSKGRPVMMQTANGTVLKYLVKFDSVKLGAIELRGVDGVVGGQDMSVALLGMSFLNRLELQHEGQTMTLMRRF
jgi:aspartyl protease family protein